MKKEKSQLEKEIAELTEQAQSAAESGSAKDTTIAELTTKLEDLLKQKEALENELEERPTKEEVAALEAKLNYFLHSDATTLLENSKLCQYYLKVNKVWR